MRGRSYTCGVDVAVSALGGRWRTIVLAQVKEGVAGFAELRRRIPGISDKMLSRALSDLVAAGLARRDEISQRPLEVRYSLTEEGHRMAPALTALNEWGEAFARGHGLTIRRAEPLRLGRS